MRITNYFQEEDMHHLTRRAKTGAFLLDLAARGQHAPAILRELRLWVLTLAMVLLPLLGSCGPI